MTTKSLIEDLAWRGLIFQQTNDEEIAKLLEKSTSLYCGFDPTAKSMQVGNLLMIIALARFRRAGHKPVALAGGATGMIGDPSGKTSERNLLSEDEILRNTEAIGAQLRTILDRAMSMHRDDDGAAEPIPVVNNADWIKPWSFLEFLRDVGRHFRVNVMMSRDSVKTRLENRDEGLSYTEFSYQLIQSYDFLHLFRTLGCELQIGGSDQWGNIVSGTDLIRRLEGKSAYGLTLPLITDADGRKFGKSEGNAVFLDADLTSPYAFYQFWVNQDDRIVVDLLKKYTFLDYAEIDALAATVNDNSNRGEVQQRLAYELTWLVHGKEEADAVVRSSKMLFGEKIEGLTDRQLSDIFADVPSYSLPRTELAGGVNAVDLFAAAFNDSKSAMRRLLQQGGGYINNERLEDAVEATIDATYLTTETKMVLRAGRKRYCVVDVK